MTTAATTIATSAFPVPWVSPMPAPIEKSAMYAMPPRAVVATTIGVQRR